MQNASNLAAWANKSAEAVLGQGVGRFAPQNLTNFALADEPGWYFEPPAPGKHAPAVPPGLLSMWMDFLKARGVMPAELGAASYAAVVPSVDRLAVALEDRKRF